MICFFGDELADEWVRRNTAEERAAENEAERISRLIREEKETVLKILLRILTVQRDNIYITDTTFTTETPWILFDDDYNLKHIIHLIERFIFIDPHYLNLELHNMDHGYENDNVLWMYIKYNDCESLYHMHNHLERYDEFGDYLNDLHDYFAPDPFNWRAPENESLMNLVLHESIIPAFEEAYLRVYRVQKNFHEIFHHGYDIPQKTMTQTQFEDMVRREISSLVKPLQGATTYDPILCLKLFVGKIPEYTQYLSVSKNSRFSVWISRVVTDAEVRGCTPESNSAYLPPFSAMILENPYLEILQYMEQVARLHFFRQEALSDLCTGVIIPACKQGLRKRQNVDYRISV